MKTKYKNMFRFIMYGLIFIIGTTTLILNVAEILNSTIDFIISIALILIAGALMIQAETF